MTEAEIAELAEADAARAAKLTRELMTSIYRQWGEDGVQELRLDTLGVLGVVLYTEDGVEAENVVASWETRKTHAKVGILQMAMSNTLRRRRG